VANYRNAGHTQQQPTPVFSMINPLFNAAQIGFQDSSANLTA
jgi:hypothetical protein